MNDRLIVAKRVRSDGGDTRVTMIECTVTNDLILKFGSSYTIRASVGEMAALLLELSASASATAGGDVDVD
jgi:hypothetical protein